MSTARASDPISTVGNAATLKADVAQALADGQTQHDAVVAAAHKVSADAAGGTRATLKADLAALHSTIQSAQSVMKAGCSSRLRRVCRP